MKKKVNMFLLFFLACFGDVLDKLCVFFVGTKSLIFRIPDGVWQVYTSTGVGAGGLQYPTGADAFRFRFFVFFEFKLIKLIRIS